MQDAKAKSFYTFSHEGQYFLFNTEKVAIYKVPEPVYEIARLWEMHPPKAIVEKLSDRFEPAEIRQAIDKIGGMGLLASSDFKTGVNFSSNGKLKEIHLQIAHDCNLNCGYCYADGGNFGGPATRMDTATARQAVDFFLDLHQPTEKGCINFDGGEPFLNWDLIENVVDYANRKARSRNTPIFYNIGTNGTLFNPHNTAFIKANNIGLGISIDGDKAKHDANRKFRNNTGSYDTVQRHFETFQNSFSARNCRARATITKTNLNCVDVVKHLLGMGFKQVYLEPVSSTEKRWALSSQDFGKVKEEFFKLARFYTGELLNGRFFFLSNFDVFLQRLHFKQKIVYKCEVGRTGAAVTPQGNIFPCYKFSGLPQYCMGNIAEEGPGKKIRSQFIDNHVDNRPGCRECWARYLCGGGCAYLAACKHNNIRSKDREECDFNRHLIKLSMQIYVTVKNKNPRFWDAFLRPRNQNKT